MSPDTFRIPVRYTCRGALILVDPGKKLVDVCEATRECELAEEPAEVGERIDGVELAGLCRPPNYTERIGGKPVVGAVVHDLDRRER